MRVTTSQHETSGNIVCSVKMQSPTEHNLPIRDDIHWNKQQFWHQVKVVCCLPTRFLHSRCDARIRDQHCAKSSHVKFGKDSNSLTFQQFDSRNQKVPKVGGTGIIKKNDYRLSLPSIFFFAPSTFCMPFTFASSPLSESLEQTTKDHASSQFCWQGGVAITWHLQFKP